MDEKQQLYDKVIQIIKRGNNAEVRRNKDGKLVVYEVKKHIVT